MNFPDSKIVETAELSGQRFFLNLSSRFAGSQGGGKFGRNTGQSLEFVEHREYQPGDDIRHLDWSAVARSDKLSIKLFREEITPHLDIIFDLSSSMAVNKAKYDALVSMAVILKRAALNSGFSVDNWLVKEMCRKIEPSALPIEAWPDFSPDYNGSTGKTLCNLLPKLKAGGARILISDLFWEEDPMNILNRVSSEAALVVIIQLVAAQDVSPELYGNIRAVDAESGQALELICDDGLLNEYKANFERHRQYWKECCTKTGTIFCYLEAENFLKTLVPESLIYNDIMRLGR